MSEQRKYDSTVARIAGNLLAGDADVYRLEQHPLMAQRAVKLARAIVAEVEHSEPKAEDRV